MPNKKHGKKAKEPRELTSLYSNRSSETGGSLAASHSRRRTLADTEPSAKRTGGGSTKNVAPPPLQQQQQQQQQEKQNKQNKQKKETNEKEKAVPPPQHVQWSARPTMTLAAVGEKDSTGSRVVSLSQLPRGAQDPALVALAGGPLPRHATDQQQQNKNKNQQNRNYYPQQPFIAVPKGTAIPPESSRRRGSATGGSWFQRVKALLFSKEEFTEFGSGSPGSSVFLSGDGNNSNNNNNDTTTTTTVRRWQLQAAAALDKMAWLPGWGKRSLFEVMDFFTRARVYLVIAVVVVAVMLAAAPKTADALSAVSGTFTVDEEFRPGKTFLEKFNNGRRDLPHKHPVAIIPGFITGALELWDAKGTCLDRQSTFFSTFRQHMFGAQMIFLLLTDPLCWLELFSMDKTTGMDKDGIKVRADSGFASVEYFMPGYWVWAKILINLADIGYDPQSMAIMTYDWRLSPELTHARDGFFYSVRNSLKFLCQKNRQRAVVISHSYGTTMALAFFKWEEQREPGFMNKYVAYYVNVGGTTMGIPKAASALLMGDVKDTVMIPAAARKIFDSFMAQKSRYNATRSWSCLYSMTPHGCDAILPDIFTFADGSTANMVTVMDMIIDECERTNHTNCVDEMQGFREEVEELPVLPQAPNTTVVCMYGVNKSAEVGYALEDVGRRSRLGHNFVTGESIAAGAPETRVQEGEEGEEGEEVADDLDAEEMEMAFQEADVAKWMTNTSHNDQNTVRGVRLGNGDGTVPLGSLAYMCRAPNGWRRNVGRVETVEFFDDAARANPLNLRGGAISGDHVDILGNYDLIETLLKIVSGVDEVGGEPDMDEVQWQDAEEKHAADISGNKKKKSTKSGEVNTITLHRRVHSRILSDVDEKVKTDWAKCLQKPNNPIQPKRTRDDNEYL